jgi:hypothetical protein
MMKSNPRKCQTPTITNSKGVNIQKREKLKKLIIEKFMKKYPNIDEYLISKEVNSFIELPTLSEKDLQSLEMHIVLLSKCELNNTLASKKREKTEDSNIENLDIQALKQENRPMTPASMAGFGEGSKTPINQKGENYVEIYDRMFGKKPFERASFDNNEWIEIMKFKAQKNEEHKRERRNEDKMQKASNRETFHLQMKEKQLNKIREKMSDKEYAEFVKENVIYLNQVEEEKAEKLRKSKELEKQIREKQLEENQKKKKINFIVDRKLDLNMSIFVS